MKEIHDGNNILVSAVTGSGKTLTAFLSILNELITLSEQGMLEDKVYCIYISPLKSLNNDVHINLETPLKEIEELAEKKLGIRVLVRTGDTTAADKQKMLKQPPHILITTPESLAIVLSSSRFIDHLRGVKYCVVDELHALAENKRGVHLSLNLERLQAVSSTPLTRIGLSATCEPIDAIAQFLVGTERDCKIAKIALEKTIDVQVISPVPDLINTTEQDLHRKLYALLDKLIQEHRTTLVFTNTRSATERVVHHLKTTFPSRYVENIAAHHGSLSKKHRLDVEQQMREGKLKTVVCSTSLELGIDIGYIDLVILLGSPKSVARALQRMGRAGHKLHDTIKARIIVLDRDDLVECAVLLRDVLQKKVDAIHIPENCLDVLAQIIHGMAVADRWNVEDLYTLIRKSYCYRTLKKDDFLEVVRYLAGEFVQLEDRYIFAKIWYDPETGEIGRRGRLSRVIHLTNIGTIPEQIAVKVKVGEKVIGTIDEAFLERLERGDIFVLGGDTYEFLFSRGMVASVKAASGKTPTVPSWFSEMLPLNFDLAMDIQKFRRYLEDFFVNKAKKDEIIHYIHETLHVDDNAAKAIYSYFQEQFLYLEIPHEKKVVVEFFPGFEDDKKYVVFHTLYGRRVNDVLSRAIAYALSKIHKKTVEIGINDNGFYLASKEPLQVMRAFDLIKVTQLRSVMERAIEKTEVLKRRFRHCAGRALMILRNYKGKKKRVGRQQVSSMILISAIRRISNDFSILKEARREVLEDLMDITHATAILKQLKEGTIELKMRHTNLPSPFAFTLVTQGYTDIMRMEDRIAFIKRMHTHVLATIGKKHTLESFSHESG